MDVITTQSRGNQFVEIKEIVLEDTTRTKLVFKAGMHPGGIRGDIIRYRKNTDGTCEKLIPVNFNSLHPNEGIKIELKTEATKKLYETLKELDALLKKEGINYGINDYAVVEANSLVITDKNKAEIIRRLLDADCGEELWKQLVDTNPEIATRLANSKLHDDRVSVLKDFEIMLNDDQLCEGDWQDFFEKNTWIFGYGLRYQILGVMRQQPHFGGTSITGTGDQRGDFLAVTEAERKFTCLVEIKKPTTSLLQREEYRNGAWGISHELAGAVSQVQVNCSQWEMNGSRTENNREILNGIDTISPKGIIVIGKTNELDNWNKRNSFERFRREIHNPEIITYDELFERVKFIVGAYEAKA